METSRIHANQPCWVCSGLYRSGEVIHCGATPLRHIAHSRNSGVARSLSDGDGRVFPSPATGRALTNEAFPKLMRELDINGTAHGMRTAFRSWAAEHGVSREVAEACLAHVVKGVEGAYQRSDLLAARAEVMQRWARYVSGKGA